MTSYLIRRFLIGLLTLLLITFVIYGLIRSMPGSPLDTEPAMLDPSKMPREEDLERLKKVYGLDKPWHTAYWVWINIVWKGDLGHKQKRQ